MIHTNAKDSKETRIPDNPGAAEAGQSEKNDSPQQTGMLISKYF